MTNTYKKHIINNCDELTLHAFIRCLEKNELQVLANYEAEKNDLENAWALIYDEFCNLTGQKKYIKLVELSKEIAQLQAKITAIDLCVNVMTYKDSETCKEILKKYGYNYKFDINDPEKYAKEIARVISVSKTSLISLQRKAQEFETIKKEAQTATNKKINFYDTLASISKFQGYRIDPKTTTVSEYAGILNNIEKANKANGRR